MDFKERSTLGGALIIHVIYVLGYSLHDLSENKRESDKALLSQPSLSYARLPLHPFSSTLFIRRTPTPHHSLELHRYMVSWRLIHNTLTRSKLSEMAQLH